MLSNPVVSTIGSNWPSLPTPSESSSPIQPGQKVVSPSPTPITPVSTWKVEQRDPEDYERDRVGKYAEFFVGNKILPITEIKKIEPKIVSLVVTDLKTRRLVGLKFLSQEFCDMGLPDANRGTAGCNIMAEGFRFMPLGLVRLRTFRLSTWVS